MKTRLLVGSLLAAAMLGVLWLDRFAAPWFPVLGGTIVALGILATAELLALVPAEQRPVAWLAHAAVQALLLLNWLVLLGRVEFGWSRSGTIWEWLLVGFVAIVLLAFLVEMARYTQPGRAVPRIALTLLAVAYLGLLPAFLVQLRWLDRGVVALALGIFVPKACDIGAYFTGKLLGRHRMTPLLSPKKTWEGAVGGLAGAVAATFFLNSFGPVLTSWSVAVGFGLSVGFAGMMGDLAESLIKRDYQTKDASTVVPGFGGVLDVVDSILFAAPLAYWWLR